MSDLLKPTLPPGPAQTFHFVRPLCKGFFPRTRLFACSRRFVSALRCASDLPPLTKNTKNPASNRLLLNPYFDPNELTYVTSYRHKGVACPPPPPPLHCSKPFWSRLFRSRTFSLSADEILSNSNVPTNPPSKNRPQTTLFFF